MDAKEIVTALRVCNNPKGRRCSNCPVFSKYEHRECKTKVDMLAAGLIDALAAENARLRAELAEQQRETASCDYLLGEADIGARAAGGEIKELRNRLELVERERDKAVADMTSIADAIANCKEYLSGGRDKVSSLQLGRCVVCKGQCHDDEPCKFEWRGNGGESVMKLSDEILQEQIAKTEQSGSPHGIFSRRKLNALLNELAEYRRAQPSEKPLTLDELRQMDGEPVYIVCGDRRDELNGWFIVYAAEQKIELPCGPETIQTVTLYNAEDELNPEVAFYGMTCAGHGNLCKNDCQHGLHQLGWLAYRSKPKEEAL